ncbi:MAG TPA: PilZ domain-containing protein [Polyangia bacterium]|jgi:uncharacterized protein (TIGR02266 family)|nr:PilZ domain-containing protein [Polyangia bacterium]
MSEHDDRRSAPRYPIRLGVSFADGEDLGRHAIVNLSEGGLFIRTSRPLPIGTEIEMAIRVGDAAPIHQTGQVTWVRGTEEEGMGVKFTGRIDPGLTALLPPHRMRPKG